MTSPASEPDVRLALADMTDRVHSLIAEVAQLERAIEEYKTREAIYVRGCSELLNAPTLLNAHLVNGQWEAVYDTGEVWRRESFARSTRDATEYGEEWVPVAAVPTSRAACKQTMDDLLAARVPFAVMPERVA